MINLHLVSLFRSADHDCGPGGLWEIIPLIGHAGGDADDQWESLLEQVRIDTFAYILSKNILMTMNIYGACDLY